MELLLILVAVVLAVVALVAWRRRGATGGQRSYDGERNNITDNHAGGVGGGPGMGL